MRGTLIAIAFVTACGGGSSTPTPDAAPVISNVEAVACAGGEQGPVTSVVGTFAYMGVPLTITVGQTVKFVMATNHNVVPDTGNDANLLVDFGATTCLKFKAAGDYSFHCGPHAFKGKITVQ